MLGSLEGVVATIDQQKADIIHALESLNNLAATLNAGKETIGSALDAVGPAIDVLADQHDELIGMLGSLDRLGEVGTRVINATKEDMLKMLEHLYPVLTKLREAGHRLAPGLNLLISFPFPETANSIVEGDYADSIGRMDIDFSNIFEKMGLPEVQLPDPNEVLDDVARCLRSGSLSSVACQKVLEDADLLRDLQRQCRTEELRDSPVCAVLNALPDLDLDQLLRGGALGDGLNGLTDGVNGLTEGLAGDPASTSTPPDGLYGGGLT